MSDTYPAEFDTIVMTPDHLPLPTGSELACNWGNAQDCQDDNNERAAFAGEAVKAYAKRTKSLDEPIETVVTDLLNDLRHLCDAVDLNFDALARDDTAYHAELRGEF